MPNSRDRVKPPLTATNRGEGRRAHRRVREQVQHQPQVRFALPQGFLALADLGQRSVQGAGEVVEHHHDEEEDHDRMAEEPKEGSPPAWAGGTEQAGFPGHPEEQTATRIAQHDPAATGGPSGGRRWPGECTAPG